VQMLAAVLNSCSDAALAGGALRYCRAREARIGQVADHSFLYCKGSDFLGMLPSFKYASTIDSRELEELPESDFSWISSLQYLQSNDDDAGLASVHDFWEVVQWLHVNHEVHLQQASHTLQSASVCKVQLLPHLRKPEA